MDYKELADLIFPDAKTVEYYEGKYPERNLEEGAFVTRFAPSPTGFIHIGGLFGAIIDKKLAKQSNGVFILRIEDTDQKREIENGISQIVDSLNEFGIIPDEGMISETKSKGNYGPYKQSERKDIYQAFAKSLIQKGLAYPCFCTPEEIEETRKKQEAAKVRPGYYGVWAKCRTMPIDEVANKIKNGEKYIIRFKSQGREDRRIKHKDLIKGNIEFPENDQDIVIIKADGLPTYHFAHVVDDHLMRTTHVIRGDEWVSSIPLHLELFKALEIKPPKYAHTATIMKEENGGKRKISKRKAPEAAVSFYYEQGIPKDAVVEYLLNIANSNFELWRKANQDKSIDEFELLLNKMNISGAVFDMVKLQDVSKNVICKFSAQKIYDEVLNWAKKYDSKLANLLKNNKEYSLKILNIERSNVKPRKDIAKWSDVRKTIEYMYEEEFKNITNFEYQKINDPEEINKIVQEYRDNFFDINDDKETWFNKMKDLSEKLGYAREVKEFKKNPEQYKGHVGDISTVIRVKLTSKCNTPDLYEIMQVLGKEEVLKRLNS